MGCQDSLVIKKNYPVMPLNSMCCVDKAVVIFLREISSWKNKKEHMLEFFYNSCLGITSKHVPPKKKTKAFKYSKVHRYRRSLTNHRRRINQRLVKITFPATQQKLHKELPEIEKNLQRSHQGSATHIEEKAVEAICSNSKFFFA